MILACPMVTIDTSLRDLEAEVKSLTSGDGVPRLVEATGAPPVVNNCFRLLRKGGKLVLIGIPKAPIHIEDPMPNVLFKSLTLTTVHGRRIFHTWEACEVGSWFLGILGISEFYVYFLQALVSSGKVDPTIIISHEFSLDQWQDAFDLLLSGKACKIVVKI